MGANTRYAGLLECAQICRDLFTLGGVPRWVVDYLALVKNARGEGETVSFDTIRDCFRNIWTKYVGKYLSMLSTAQCIRLAASAIAGQPASPSDTFDGDVKWLKLRDSSLCLLTPCVSGGLDVQIPYALLQSVGSLHDEKATVVEKEFAKSLNDLKKYVDDPMLDVQAWQSGEVFGACFYAVRINALRVLGHTTVTLEKLLPSALMNREMDDISVKLVPSRVF